MQSDFIDFFDFSSTRYQFDLSVSLQIITTFSVCVCYSFHKGFLILWRFYFLFFSFSLSVFKFECNSDESDLE